ncbi:hypothetical protein Hanom_Chr05g00434391 [Helianthus anomalus]
MYAPQDFLWIRYHMTYGTLAQGLKMSYKLFVSLIEFTEYDDDNYLFPCLSL